MDHGNVRYGNAYSPYPYGTPTHNESTTSVSSLASTSSKIINLFKSDKKSKKKKDKNKNMSLDGPPVPEKDYPPSFHNTALGTSPYATGNGALPSSSSLSLSLSVSDASGHSASGSTGQRNPDRPSNSLFKLGKGRKKKEKHAESISTPWNVKHEMHVDGGLSGFPSEWQASLIQLGYSLAEIQQMVDQRHRSPAVHANLIPVGPSASTPAATTSLNTTLLQNQSISLTQLQYQSQALSHPNGNTTGGDAIRYPSPPQQYALPNLKSFNLSLQTESVRKQHSSSASSSPVTYAPRPVQLPVRAGSPAMPDRTNSPASSTRSHPQHQVSHSLSGSEARASPVPSIRKEASGIGASGLSNSPISNSPISNPTLKHLGSVTTAIAMGLGSNTMSSSAPTTTTTSNASPTSVRRPVRPPPPPPLFGPTSSASGGISGISTGRANTYKPHTAIAVQGDEDEEGDEEEDNLPLDSVAKKATVGAGKERRLVLMNAAPGDCLSPASATPTSQNVMPNITTNISAAELSSVRTVERNSTETALTGTTIASDPINTNKSAALSLDGPPRLSLGIPRISLELGKLDLDLSPSLSSSLGFDSSDHRQSVDWSESIFSALPSATAFGSFRSSVMLPGNSPKASPGLTPSPSSRTGAHHFGGSGSAGASPVGSTDRASPAGLSPASANSSPGVSPVLKDGNGRTPSPVVPPQPHNAFAYTHSPSTFTSTYSSAWTQPRHVVTEFSEHIRQLVMHSSTENASEETEGGDDDGVDRRSIINRDSIASSNVLGHELLSHSRNPADMQSHDRYRESVSTESTESTARQSVSSFGVDDDDEGLGMVETVVVARATAVKLARAPSVTLRGGADAFAIGRRQRQQQQQQQVSVATKQYSPMQGNGYNGYSGFDEEDEEESDSDGDEDDSDEEDEDPNSRETIRLDNIDADRLMNAVMRSHGDLDQQLAPGEMKNSRPLSTSTVATTRPVSTSTVRLTPSDGPGKSEEKIVDEEDSSALDDWLEANETEDQAKEESPETSDRSEYDDADYPLSAISASSEKTLLPLHRDAQDELNSDSDSDSDYSPSGVNGSYDQVDRSATPVAEEPVAATVAAAVHVRSGSASGSGSSHAGSGSNSHRTQRSSMIYVPRPTLSPQLQQLLRPLLSFIHSGDPRSIYSELQQVAEGESGGIYAAYPSGQSSGGGVAAIKRVKLQEETRLRIETLGRELTLLDGVKHINILSYSAVWLVGEPGSSLDGSVELWIQMDLMDRSLADLLGLLEDGLVIEERHVACFAKDVANALAFLEDRFIAHRDVRSDNLLISGDGIVKLADFATAVQVSKGNTSRNDDAGVIYWQAPEIRRGVYDAMKVDVWSLGATVWELIEGETPFENDPNGPSDRLPEITRTDLQQVSQGLLGFLNLCEAPAERRPNARSLLKTPFIRAACPRDEVLRLLSQALDIERAISSG